MIGDTLRTDEGTMDLQDLQQIDRATRFGRAEMGRLGAGVAFLVGVIVYTGIHHAGLPGGYLLIAAAVAASIFLTVSRCLARLVELDLTI